jgi:non-specific serine/threonine protein kinase/serine/threonine-protein kinase
MASLAAFGLVLGLAGTLTEARRAAVQRDFALKQLSRAEAINEMNSLLLTDAAASGKPVTSDELLARAETVIEKEWGGSAENRVEALVSIGRQYWGQDEDEKARRVLTKAYGLAKTLPDPALRAKTAAALASAVARGGDADRAEALAKEGIALYPDEPQYALDRVAALSRGSEVARERGDIPLAIERAEAAQRIYKASGIGSQNEALSIAMELGESYRMAGRAQEADAAFADADARLTALGRGDTQKAGTLLNNWALVRDFLGRPLEAEKLYRRAVAISQSPMLLNNLARTLRDLNRLPEAADYSQRALDKARASGDQVVVNQSLIVRSSVARMTGDFAVAESLLGEVEARFTKMLPKGHAAFGSLASEQSLLAQSRGDFPRAKELADRAVAVAEASKQKGEYLPRVLIRRAVLEDDMRLFEAAAADARRTLAHWRGIVWEDSRSASVGRSYLALGRALEGLGDAAGAGVAYGKALAELEPTLGPDHPDTAEALRRKTAQR